MCHSLTCCATGVGRLGLPLSREQAATLKSVAEQAPHGKGLRTVVDTAVRDAFQVDHCLEARVSGPCNDRQPWKMSHTACNAPHVHHESDVEIGLAL